MDSGCPAQLHQSSHEREKAAAHLRTAISLKDLAGGRPLAKHFADAHIWRNAHKKSLALVTSVRNEVAPYLCLLLHDFLAYRSLSHATRRTHRTTAELCDFESFEGWLPQSGA